MAVAITLTPRLLYKEDMSLATVPTGLSTTDTVLTTTGPQTLSVTKLDIVFYSSFTIAANDVAAAAGGVGVGVVYCTPAGVLRTRMS